MKGLFHTLSTNQDIDTLIKNFKLGDEKSFRFFYDKYYPSIRYFAAKYIDGISLPDDAAQEAFVKLWQQRENFNDENSIKAFLYNVTKNDCLNLLRHEHVKNKYSERITSLESDVTDSFINNIIESELIDMIFKVFDELSPACSKVYKLSLEGKQYDEIAQILNISINTVKKHKNNANKYMRSRLKNILSFLLYLNC